MITYNAKDLIKRAKQLADLENSDFISWNEQINLLNENYVALYQKLCNIGDEAFIREFTCGVGVTELPVDFFQLKSVSLNNHGNIVPILRRAETQSYNDCYYELKNGKLIIGGYSGEYIVKYFPQPMTLIFKPEAVKIEDALLSYFTENTVLNAFDKRYFLSNGSILDIEEASVIGTTGESTEDTSGFISVMDNSKIVAKGYIYNYNKLVKDTDAGFKDEAYLYYKNKIEKLTKSTPDELGRFNLYTVAGGRPYLTFDIDFDLEDGYDVRLILADDTLQDVWYFVCSTSDGSCVGVYHNGEYLALNLGLASPKLYNGEMYLFDDEQNAYKITSDNEFVSLDENIIAYNKFDDDTGYGYTVKEGGKVSIVSFLENSVLNFPNNFYYNILSYYLAIAFKIKQGGDISSLGALLDKQEMTFFDTLTNDDYGAVRIANVY